LLCRDTISARTVIGHSLLLARLPGTHWVTICVIQRLALTVSDMFSRLVCFQSTSISSALEVLHSMRYINLRFTYLLTYIRYPSRHTTFSDVDHRAVLIAHCSKFCRCFHNSVCMSVQHQPRISSKHSLHDFHLHDLPPIFKGPNIIITHNVHD